MPASNIERHWCLLPIAFSACQVSNITIGHGQMSFQVITLAIFCGNLC
jgi:hypothetical protein